MRLIDKAINDDGDLAHFAIKVGTSAMVRTSQATVYARLVEGRFPRYADVFPKTCTLSVPIVAGAFRSAIDQAAVVTSDESRAVSFRFSKTGIELSSRSADIGESKVELPMEIDAEEDLVVDMDNRFAGEGIKSLDPESELAVDLVDSKSPVTFRLGDEFTYVVMPLTRD
jgi:DNA polymerase-3 subunit beta